MYYYLPFERIMVIKDGDLGKNSMDKRMNSNNKKRKPDYFLHGLCAVLIMVT
ncbi:hypothetical protein BDF14DRAFT_1864187 [Spinellus fusiger]|nr:hypothetical protein BDF14DRAFT_1864187 [Spinellus fusiger]